MRDALAGIRVLDFTWVVGGPLCTKYLALMGAEVIKVETSTRPEHLRRGGHFALLNEGKRSCTVDLKQPEGAALVRRLAGLSDVVVENFAPGVMERLGLGYEALSADRDDLVMLSISGTGQSGPDSRHLAYGSLLQSYAGWTLLLREEEELADDRMGMVPVWADHLAATMGALAVVSALHERDRSGAGQYLDLSVLESVLALMPQPIMEWTGAGVAPRALGNASPDCAPHGAYPALGEDRWVAICACTPERWAALVREMGEPAWVAAEGFDQPERRLAGRGRLDALIAGWTAPQDQRALVARLQAAGVPAGASASVRDLVADEHLAAREFFTHGPSQVGLGLPWRQAGASRAPASPAPALGQDNDHVFTQVLGLTAAEVAGLRERKVIA